MPKTFLPLVVILALAGSVVSGQAAKTNPRALKLALDSTSGIEAANGKLDVVNYRGRRALQLVPLTGHEAADDSDARVRHDHVPDHFPGGCAQSIA